MSTKQILHKAIFIFVLFFILTFPFPYQVLPNVAAFFAPLFEGLIEFFGKNLFQFTEPFTAQILSDSTGLYIHSAFLLIGSVLVGILWKLLDSKPRPQLFSFFRLFVSYYLSLQLFIYGFNKIFKHQFYLPEPNILYTSIGEATPDILYWTVMGSSYCYSFFAGVVEVLPAALLLFRKTRLLGALIAFAVLINVQMINLSFDISVKLYSFFLLFLSLYLIAPYFKRLHAFFIQEQTQIPSSPILNFSSYLENPQKKLFASLVKSLLIGLILFESLFLYFKTNNFNDDLANRPFLHGAYEVTNMLTEKSQTFERFFIHRRGYFITQNAEGKMQDYKMTIEQETNPPSIKLLDYKGKTHTLYYLENEKNDLFNLSGLLNDDTIFLLVAPIDYKELPLLQKPFHWTIDVKP